MTDYRNYGHLPRPLPEVRFTRLMLAVVIILVLAAFSLAGKEDMTAQGEIDKQVVLEHVSKVVAADEQAALYFYTARAK